MTARKDESHPPLAGWRQGEGPGDHPLGSLCQRPHRPDQTGNLRPAGNYHLTATKSAPGRCCRSCRKPRQILGYIPVPMQDVIAAELNLPGSDIFGTMSFYSLFAWKPKGKYVIRMCQSPPCHINGAENTLLALQEELGLTVGQTTRGRPFYPGVVGLPGGLRSGPGHADQ